MSPVQCLKKKKKTVLLDMGNWWEWSGALLQAVNLRWSIFVGQGDECNPGCGKQAVVSGDNLVMCLSLKAFKVFCKSRSFTNFPDFLNTCVGVFFKSCGPSYLKLLQKNVMEPIYWEKTPLCQMDYFYPKLYPTCLFVQNACSLFPQNLPRGFFWNFSSS